MALEGVEIVDKVLGHNILCEKSSEEDRDLFYICGFGESIQD